MWIRFTGSMDFKPKPMMTRSYKPGDVKNVTRECAAKALALGKGVKTSNPRTLKSETADGDKSEVDRPRGTLSEDEPLRAERRTQYRADPA